MLLNTLKLFFVVLLMTLSLSKANILMCPMDMDEDTCKDMFMKLMDETFREFHMDMMKLMMFKLSEAFKPMIKEMPAGDSYTKLMTNAVDVMADDMKKMDEMMTMTDRTKLQELIEKFYKDMQPDPGMAFKEDSTHQELFAKLSEKYGYDRRMLDDLLLIMLRDYETLWMNMYFGLREKDLMKYPMLKEINEMMVKMMESNDREVKAEMMVKTIKKMMDMQETPYMMAMLMGMCQGQCKF